MVQLRNTGFHRFRLRHVSERRDEEEPVTSLCVCLGTWRCWTSILAQCASWTSSSTLRRPTSSWTNSSSAEKCRWGGGGGLVVLLHWDPPDTGTDFAGYHTSGHFLCRQVRYGIQAKILILKLSAFYVLSVFFGKMTGKNFNDLHLHKSNEWIFYSTFVLNIYILFLL